MRHEPDRARIPLPASCSLFFRCSPRRRALLGPVFAFMGAMLSVVCITDLARHVASTSWPVADGVILASSEAQARLRGHRTVYTVAVQYEYRVGSTTYVGDRYRLRNNVVASPAEAQALAASHPAGAAVEVRHNPSNPRDSCLITGSSAFDWLAAIGCPLIAIYGIAATVSGIRELRWRAVLGS